MFFKYLGFEKRIGKNRKLKKIEIGKIEIVKMHCKISQEKNLVDLIQRKIDKYESRLLFN